MGNISANQRITPFFGLFILMCVCVCVLNWWCMACMYVCMYVCRSVCLCGVCVCMCACVWVKYISYIFDYKKHWTYCFMHRQNAHTPHTYHTQTNKHTHTHKHVTQTSHIHNVIIQRHHTPYIIHHTSYIIHHTSHITHTHTFGEISPSSVSSDSASHDCNFFFSPAIMLIWS